MTTPAMQLAQEMGITFEELNSRMAAVIGLPSQFVGTVKTMDDALKHFQGWHAWDKTEGEAWRKAQAEAKEEAERELSELPPPPPEEGKRRRGRPKLSESANKGGMYAALYAWKQAKAEFRAFKSECMSWRTAQLAAIDEQISKQLEMRNAALEELRKAYEKERDGS